MSLSVSKGKVKGHLRALLRRDGDELALKPLNLMRPFAPPAVHFEPDPDVARPADGSGRPSLPSQPLTPPFNPFPFQKTERTAAARLN